MVKNLKKMRNLKGVSQQTLATAIGTSQQSINKYENHNIEPDIATLIAMADYFNITVDYLIGRDDDNNTKLSSSDVVFSKYNKLGSKEKECIKNIIDTFDSLKA